MSQKASWNNACYWMRWLTRWTEKHIAQAGEIAPEQPRTRTFFHYGNQGSSTAERTSNLNMKISFPLLLTGMLATLLGGCATKDYVNEQIASVDKRMEAQSGKMNDLGSSLGTVNSDIKAQGGRIDQNVANISQASKLAHDALDRANAAHVLAEGKLLDEVVLTDDKAKFAFNKYGLSKKAKAVLDDFASQLKSENKNVYIEIQGHTDNRGSKAYNMKLGLERAEAVRDYLNQVGIPLHRMNVISYGESRPVVDNKTPAHRAQNRRVVLEVLQ
jgi:peptidoglycan-associated lipoprotein